MMHLNQKGRKAGTAGGALVAFLLMSLVAMADPEAEPRATESGFTAQDLWFSRLDKFAGRWVDSEGAFEATATYNGGFSVKTKDAWPELEEPRLLSPQMEFFAGEHLYELWLGDYPEQWMLLLRFSNLEGSKLEVPEFRVFQREAGAGKGDDAKKPTARFVEDLNIGWRLRLLISSGEWESEDGEIQMNVNYRSMTFPRLSSWPELKGFRYLVGSTKNFQVAGFHFSMQLPHANLDEIVIFRRKLADSSLEAKTFKRVKKK